MMSSREELDESYRREEREDMELSKSPAVLRGTHANDARMVSWRQDLEFLKL